MAQPDALTIADNQDDIRIRRMFAGVITSALGVDNNYISEDGQISQPANQFQVFDPFYTDPVTQGRTYTVGAANAPGAQGALVISPLMLVLAAVAAYLLLKG